MPTKDPIKARDNLRKWRKNNREKYLAHRRQYYADNIEKERARGRKSTLKRRTERPEEVRQYEKQYREENKELISKIGTKANKKYRANNKEKIKEYNDNWRKQNPEKAKAIKNRRRAREHNAPGWYTDQQAGERIEFFGNVCAYCGGPYEHLDHVIPLAKGGSNWPANLRPSCAACNTKKQVKPWRNWPIVLQSNYGKFPQETET